MAVAFGEGFFFFFMIFVDCALIEVQFISNVVYKKSFYSLGEGEGCSMCDQVMGILLIGWWWANQVVSW